MWLGDYNCQVLALKAAYILKIFGGSKLLNSCLVVLLRNLCNLGMQ